MSATLHTWVAEPLSVEVRTAIDRLAGTEDVARVAVMPDVHLAHAVCIGTVTATRRRIYPAAVGGDIGCGVAVVCLGVAAAAVDERDAAARVLAGLYERVPFIKHAPFVAELPPGADANMLSLPVLSKLARRGFHALFRYELRTAVASMGLPESLIDRVGAYEPASFAATDDRRIVGSMVDYRHLFTHGITHDGGLARADVAAINVFLNSTPMSVLGMDWALRRLQATLAAPRFH